MACFLPESDKNARPLRWAGGGNAGAFGRCYSEAGFDTVIPYRKLGRAVRFSAPEIREWVKTRTVKPTALERENTSRYLWRGADSFISLREWPELVRGQMKSIFVMEPG